MMTCSSPALPGRSRLYGRRLFDRWCGHSSAVLRFQDRGCESDDAGSDPRFKIDQPVSGQKERAPSSPGMPSRGLQLALFEALVSGRLGGIGEWGKSPG